MLFFLYMMIFPLGVAAPVWCTEKLFRITIANDLIVNSNSKPLIYVAVRAMVSVNMFEINITYDLTVKSF